MRREVLLTVVAVALGQAQDLPVVFTIEPTVITDCRDGLGRATLRWNDPAGRQLQVRVNGLNGTPLTGYDSSGAAETGYWVTNGMTFLLVDGGGRQLGQVTARVACSTISPALQAALASQPYLPLEVGNQWVYRVSNRAVTNDYIVWRVERTEESGGYTWFVISETGSSGGRSERRYRVEGDDRVYVGDAPIQALAVNGRLASINTAVGTLADALSYTRFPSDGNIFETGVLVRGVGFVQRTQNLLAGSSGGLLNQLELVEARLASGAIVLKAPAPSIELGPIEQPLNVSGRKVPNCAVPCYFVACSLAPGTDPPGTYKPCTGVRVKASNLGSGTIGLRLTNEAGAEVWRIDVVNDTPAGEWVRYERVPLYTAPNEPLPPGRYRLAAVSPLDSASTILEIQ